MCAKFHCLFLFTCRYFALVVILCFTGQVKSLYYQPNASEVLWQGSFAIRFHYGSYIFSEYNLTITLLSMLHGFKSAGNEGQIQKKHLLVLESRLCGENLPQVEGSLAFPSHSGQANFHKLGEPFTYLARFLERLPPNGRLPSKSIFSGKNYLQNSHYQN